MSRAMTIKIEVSTYRERKELDFQTIIKTQLMIISRPKQQIYSFSLSDRDYFTDPFPADLLTPLWKWPR